MSIDIANPGYRGKHHLIRSWLIEFDEKGLPHRELGLDESDSVVVAGSSESDYGFWCDTNMQLSDFEGESISSEYFEKLWGAFGPTVHSTRTR